MMLVRNGKVIWDSRISAAGDLEELRKKPQLGTLIKSRRWGRGLDAGDDPESRLLRWSLGVLH